MRDFYQMKERRYIHIKQINMNRRSLRKNAVLSVILITDSAVCCFITSLRFYHCDLGQLYSTNSSVFISLFAHQYLAIVIQRQTGNSYSLMHSCLLIFSLFVTALKMYYCSLSGHSGQKTATSSLSIQCKKLFTEYSCAVSTLQNYSQCSQYSFAKKTKV